MEISNTSPIRIINSPHGKFAAVLVGADLFRDSEECATWLKIAEQSLALPVVLHDLPNFGNLKNMQMFGGKEEWREYLRTSNFFELPAISF